ncbi:hypothetical protein GCM10009760_46080 [Kitasatospora kazusensis]|uniref:Lipoprotein n=1 Tax=Kitasatospora kazusensis TaxID=407974 RepID=A0ABN3A056_9ACTN
MTAPRRYRAAALLPAALALGGCSHGSAGPVVAAHPASLVAIPGSTLHQVVLTEDSARRLGVRTEPVRPAPAAADAASGLTAVATTALVYDPQGASWTYTPTGPLAYTRSPVTVDHVSGNVTVLRAGPPAGTPVVTVGVPELLGTEYGVGEE